jgi:hypothetical protein
MSKKWGAYGLQQQKEADLQYVMLDLLLLDLYQGANSYSVQNLWVQLIII